MMSALPIHVRIVLLSIVHDLRYLAIIISFSWHVYSSHPPIEITKILCGQLNCLVNLPMFRLDALVILRANVDKFYRTVELSVENLCLLHADSN